MTPSSFVHKTVFRNAKVRFFSLFSLFLVAALLQAVTHAAPALADTKPDKPKPKSSSSKSIPTKSKKAPAKVVSVKAASSPAPSASLAARAVPAQAAMASAVSSASASAKSLSTLSGVQVSENAMWVWGSPDPKELIDFALLNKVDRLFLSVPLHVDASSSLKNIKDTISLAHSNGIKVDALGGDPEWIDNPSWVFANWLEPVLRVPGFDGLHLDAEPYLNSKWNDNKSSTINNYLAMLSMFKNITSLPIEVDVPFWFNTLRTSTHQRLDEAVLEQVDGVSIMAYRNLAQGEDGSIELSLATLQAAEKADKYARIGQETNFLGKGAVEEKQTFHGKSKSFLRNQVSLLDSAFTPSGLYGIFAYRGVAFHDYDGLKKISD